LGGAALLIYGSVSDDRLHPPAAPRSLVDRLLGRTPAASPAWSSFGHDRRMIDLPAGALAQMGTEFTDYVANHFSQPWKATSAILEYLRLDITSVYVRGEATGSNLPEWYVQVTFSGCAGMSQVSSELAVHWAQRWYAEHQGDLTTKYLEPSGFKPNGRTEAAAPAPVFVPLGAAGYARFDPVPRPVDEEIVESRFFEIDAAATETLDDAEKAKVMQMLDEKLPPMLPSGSCCCQLCAPDFNAAACDRLVPFW
jgi:hypothetical protein